MSTLVRTSLIATLLLAVASNSARGLEPLRVVALSEDIGLEAPLIDANGRTLFLTARPPRGRIVADDSLTAAAPTFDATTTRGLYAETQLGMPELVASYGQQPTGTDYGTLFHSFENLRLNANGDIAFTAGGAHFGRQGGESLRLIVRGGQTISLPDMTEDQVSLQYAPGLPFPIALDSDGLVTTPAHIPSLFTWTRWFEIGQNVLRESPDGSVQLVENKFTVSTTTRISGTSEYVPTMLDVTAIPNSPITINAKGDASFWATLIPPDNHGTTFSRTEAFVSLSATGANQVRAQAWETTVLDGQATIYRFDYPARTAMHADGDVVFLASLRGAASGPAILRSTGDELSIVAKFFDPAPGAEDGAIFSDFDSIVGLNDRGETLFLASLGGPSTWDQNAEGLFLDRGSQRISLVLRGDDPAPGTDEGVTFDHPRGAIATVNNAGQVAFSSYLRRTDSTSDFGIWAQDRQGELHLIAREGDELDVSAPGEPADLRTILSLYFLENEGIGPAYGTAFNDRGQLAFAAAFTDGTHGIFVSNAVAVPEPVSVVALMGGLLMLVAYRAKCRYCG